MPLRFATRKKKDFASLRLFEQTRSAAHGVATIFEELTLSMQDAEIKLRRSEQGTLAGGIS
jgi:hypothetical protein